MKEDAGGDPAGLKGKVLEAGTLVEYQHGSVVSREILRSASGTVTVFAFDEGEGLSEHAAPFDALVHAIDGTVEVRISGEPIRLTAGEMVVMPAGKPHALKAISRFKMVLTLMKK